MRRFAICALLLAACGDSRPAPAPEPPPPVTPAPPPPPPVAKPLTFHDAFALPFGVIVTGVRMDAAQGPCRVGVEYRRDSTIHARSSIDVWSYAAGGGNAPCDPADASATTIPTMFRAVEQLAGLGREPLALDIEFREPRTLQRYLAAVSTLPADADPAIVAKRVFDQNVFASWSGLVAAMGYRVTGVELFRLEPAEQLGDLTAAELRAMAAPGPYPPRIPVRVGLVIESLAGPPPKTNPTATPRTFAALYGVPFEVSIMTLDVRTDQTPCSVAMSLSRGGLRFSGDPASCELSTEQLERELPAMIRAGSELLGEPRRDGINLVTRFDDPRVLARWIPVIRSTPRERDYTKLTARMKEAGIFAHLDPLIAALGMKLKNVSIEKLGSETGKELLARHPSLASTELKPKDVILMPMMTVLVLER